jgi:anti-sigma factor RsiW
MSDLHFDRALRGAARRGRPEGVCPDAAALASYVDRSLSPDERAALEAHIASCPTCMEHLALLAAVDAPETPADPSVGGRSSESSVAGAGWCQWPPSYW